MVNNVIHPQINLRVNLSKSLIVVNRPVGDQYIIMVKLANNHAENLDYNDERMVRGSNYCAHNVEVRNINDIYGFNEEGDNIIVFAPRGVHTTDVSIRLLDASFVNGEIDFLHKIRENTYKYVG